jgi:transcriptional regulator with XRE-family HTH domain
MQLGQAIAQIRKERGLTQEAFAKMYNVTRQTVSNWENEKSHPDLSTLVKISLQIKSQY